MSAEVRDLCARSVIPGMRTRELDDIVKQYCAENKVKASFYRYMGFPGRLCVSVNDEVIHGIPGDRIIQPGDIVKCDVGIQHNGFNGDTSRTVMVSSPKRSVATGETGVSPAMLEVVFNFQSLTAFALASSTMGASES